MGMSLFGYQPADQDAMFAFDQQLFDDIIAEESHCGDCRWFDCGSCVCGEDFAECPTNMGATCNEFEEA